MPPQRSGAATTAPPSHGSTHRLGGCWASWNSDSSRPSSPSLRSWLVARRAWGMAKVLQLRARHTRAPDHTGPVATRARECARRYWPSSSTCSPRWRRCAQSSAAERRSPLPRPKPCDRSFLYLLTFAASRCSTGRQDGGEHRRHQPRAGGSQADRCSTRRDAQAVCSLAVHALPARQGGA